MDFLYGAAGGGVVGIIAVIFGVFAISYLKRIISERDVLAEKRLSSIEKRLDDHLLADNPFATAQDLLRIRGDLTRLNNQFERNIERQRQESEKINRSLGEISGTLSGINTWMQNTNKSVQNHITNMEIHNNGKR